MPKANVKTYPDLKDTVEKLVAKYQVALADVDPSKIIYLSSEGKSQKVAKISAIKVPHPSVTPFKFSILVYEQNWNELDASRQVLHILRELLRIVDFEESKLGPYETTDFPVLLEKYGVTWEHDDNLPDPLSEKEEIDEEFSEEKPEGPPQEVIDMKEYHS